MVVSVSIYDHQLFSMNMCLNTCMETHRPSLMESCAHCFDVHDYATCILSVFTYVFPTRKMYKQKSPEMVIKVIGAIESLDFVTTSASNVLYRLKRWSTIYIIALYSLSATSFKGNLRFRKKYILTYPLKDQNGL